MNSTNNKYNYVSLMAGSPDSCNFYALLTMPNGDQRKVQIRNGQEYICGSSQHVTINFGDMVEWVYMLTLVDLEERGMYLHLAHWKFSPEVYCVNVLSRGKRALTGDILPNIVTSNVTFIVQEGPINQNMLDERNCLNEWESYLKRICIKSKQYQSLLIDVQSSDGETRENAMYILRNMTRIGMKEHALFMEMWHMYVKKYHARPNLYDRKPTIFMLGNLYEILRKMNTKESKELILNCDKEILKSFREGY
jgi:hypothetical protein